MTTTTTASPATRQTNRRGWLGKAVAERIERLQSDYLRGSPRARADLAKLRRALGKPAGTVPEAWEYTLAAVPAALQGQHDEPNRHEQAAHAALTLFALHQQSMQVPAHMPGQSLARAIGRLSGREERSQQAVTRRFMAVATAQSIEEILTHIRGLVTQLRSAKLGFDYGRFAEDLVGLLTPERAQRVRLAWGRDFYRGDPTTSESPQTPNANTEKE